MMTIFLIVNKKLHMNKLKSLTKPIKQISTRLKSAMAQILFQAPR